MLSSSAPAVVVGTVIAGAVGRLASRVLPLSSGTFFVWPPPNFFFSVSPSLALLRRVDGDILRRVVLVSLRSDAGMSRCEARRETAFVQCDLNRGRCLVAHGFLVAGCYIMCVLWL
jgi:hypothetical protein